jgi:hypothetical protein
MTEVGILFIPKKSDRVEGEKHSIVAAETEA